MSGSLRVVGIGPGPERWITPEVTSALAQASDVLGYYSYVSRLSLRAEQTLHASDNGDELARAQHALRLAEQGARVVVVSGGDPGVFAMAAAIFEAIELGPPSYRALDVQVFPGVTAMLAAASALGAPLGNDFCAINLSDNLKPWPLIEPRLSLAARADFVICLYNPASRARPEQVFRAFELLRGERAGETLVVFAKAVGRPDQELHVTTLAEADPALADMRTLLLFGASSTRKLERPGKTPWVYSPRKLREAP